MCSLTGEHANFGQTCPDYEYDQAEYERIEALKERREREAIEHSHNMFDNSQEIYKKGGNVALISGIIGMCIGLGFLLLSLFSFGHISIVAVVILVVGIVFTVKGATDNANKNNNRQF